jgi:hypothetical protein
MPGNLKKACLPEEKSGLQIRKDKFFNVAQEVFFQFLLFLLAVFEQNF